MCAHCGCLAMQAVNDLTREHDAAIELIDNARVAIAAQDAVAAGRLCEALTDLLAPHTAVEEESLFPAMARDHPDYVGVLHREHEEIHAALGALRTGPPESGWHIKLTGVLELLRLHIRKEEDGLFPAALTTLTTAQWERVDAVRARVGSALDVAQAPHA